MKFLLALCLCAAVSMATANAATVVDMTPSTNSHVMFIKSLDPDAQEQAAITFFQTYYPQGRVATAADVVADGLADIGVVWMHCDHQGLERGAQPLLQYYAGDDAAASGFASVLKEYSQGGGNMYVSGQAVQMLYAIDRLDAATHPLAFYGNAGNTKPLTETWSVSSLITDGQHADHNGHAIYGHILDDYAFDEVPLEQNPVGVYPMMAPEEGQTLLVDDNNCIWEGNINDFHAATNSQVLGTWGQNSGDVHQMGIVEFLPDQAAVAPDATLLGWKGNVIANGLGCCEWAPDGQNRYAAQLQKLTYNTVNYLAKLFNESTALPAVEAAPDQAPAPVYYDLLGRPLANPAPGTLCIRRQGNNAAKIVL